MIHRTCAALVCVCLALIAMPTMAMAGDLGVQSRGALTISITIPAHFQATQAPRADGMAVSSNHKTVCILTGGQSGSYHLALIDRSETQSGNGRIPLELKSVSSTEAAQKCGSRGSAALSTAMMADGLGRFVQTSFEPLTLLVVPD